MPPAGTAESGLYNQKARLKVPIPVRDRSQLGRSLTPTDTADIAAFFESLTGDVPDHYAEPK